MRFAQTTFSDEEFKKVKNAALDQKIPLKQFLREATLEAAEAVNSEPTTNRKEKTNGEET